MASDTDCSRVLYGNGTTDSQHPKKYGQQPKFIFIQIIA